MKTVACSLVFAALPAWAAEADFLRCRGVADSTARLACYDAVPAATSAPAAPTVGAPLPKPLTAASSAAFGLEARQAQAVAGIQSSLPGKFEGWGPRQVFKLANGQAWQVVDDSSAYYELKDPKVTIKRAALGSFLLEIQGVNHVIRVRRVE